MISILWKSSISSCQIRIHEQTQIITYILWPWMYKTTKLMIKSKLAFLCTISSSNVFVNDCQANFTIWIREYFGKASGMVSCELFYPDRMPLFQVMSQDKLFPAFVHLDITMKNIVQENVWLCLTASCLRSWLNIQNLFWNHKVTTRRIYVLIT